MPFPVKTWTWSTVNTCGVNFHEIYDQMLTYFSLFSKKYHLNGSVKISISISVYMYLHIYQVNSSLQLKREIDIDLK